MDWNSGESPSLQELEHYRILALNVAQATRVSSMAYTFAGDVTV